MSPTKPEPLTFLIPGQERRPETGRSRGGRIPPRLSAELSLGTVKQSVSVGVGRAGGVVPVQAVPDEDVVVLEIANGPDLILHPETARDLMLAQHPPTSGRGAAGGNGAGAGSITVPIALGWQGLEDPAVARGAVGGLLGRVLLSAVHVVTGLGTKWAAAEIAEKVDAQVDAGVYRLSREALPPLKGSGVPGVEHGADGKPLLVLIHGTFSNTGGTFGKLWTAHPQLVGTLFQHYDDRVYGLDHPTLGQSPIANAITLAESLPPGARLHLVTHSRGGLVAEVLARLSAHPELSAEELEFFQGDAYDDQRQELQRLATLLEDKDIRVERVVRVACPARGTLLASKRLDAYLSVFKWSLQLAGIPVAPVLLDLMAQVARQRTDPGVLPGLAAQIPDSPLIQWLHAAENPLGGELRVVAGDGEGDSITSWLKTLVSDAFYWTDNDLVVQTRSMYGGAPRTHAATFLLDRGAKVSHFTYFSNPRTAEAIVDALRDDEPRGFGTIGPRSLAGESSSGSRAALRAQASTIPPGEKPAVFLLPGILGSNLKIGRERIWLGWRLINGLMRLAYTPPRPDGVEPDGPLDSVYDRLGDFLSRSHEVIEFGYDWRKPIEQVAQLLADEVEKALDVRSSNGQPVRLLAHSMGGIVARTMQLERPKVWEQMMSRPGGRLLMLGTPNAGSWAPMQVLSGDDTFGNLLAIFGAPFHDRQARELMARFPGFLQLQAALLDGTPDLSRHETWRRLAEEDVRLLRQRSWWHHLELQLRAYEWGVPPQEVLDQAKGLRQRLDEQAKQGFGGTKDSIVMVAGRAPFTPDGFQTGADGLVYLDARDGGDSRVTLKSLRLEGVRVWQLNADHGSLPERKEAFEAYQELLEKGTTTRLKPLLPPTRGVAEQQPISHVRSRPSRARPASRPPETSGELLGAASTGPVAVGRPDQVPLRITVHNGDLTFVREPLLIGHYRSSRLTGTESVMDRVIGKLMSEALKVGDYPDLPGTYATFPNAQPPQHNPWQLPRPEAV
ncbi:MAG TPA: hypothetical protein VE420_14530, partial [Gemmatimonadales bacterium]|nr:hypothetical protein [Gemmatimonadales bacterium]